VLEHALVDTLWRVHEVPGPPPWMDAKRLDEQRRRLPVSSYRRLFENEWVAPEDRLTSVDDLAACVRLDGPVPAVAGTDYVIGLDIGLRNDRTVAAVCHAEHLTRKVPYRDPEAGWLQRTEHTGATVVLDRMEVWQGRPDSAVLLSEVEEWLAQAAKAYRAKVVYDPFQAVGSMQRLQARGVRVEEFTFSSASVGRLASTLHLLLRNRSLALPNDEELLDELANVRLRETTPGVLRMDHDADRHDDRAIALALATTSLLERGPGAVGVSSVTVWE
jgi:phage terminase large subunit-like protein